MLINNIDILKQNNATLTGRDIQSCTIVTLDEWMDNSLSPNIINQKERYSSIKVNLLIEGISEDDVLLKLSNIINSCKSGKLKFRDLSYSYNFILDTHNEKLVSEKLYELTLNFKCDFKIYEESIISMDRMTSKSFYIAGNTKTPCIVEITPLYDTIELVITGLNERIVIKNLHANKKIIIDGIEGTVTELGANKFADTDFWEFPFLIPGTNTIGLSKDTCNVTIKYNPRYL